MFAVERQKEILKIINEKGSIKVSEIQKRFNVGYETAKKDLAILESEGKIKRTYGGALKIDLKNNINNDIGQNKGTEILKIILPKLVGTNNVFIESNILNIIDMDNITYSGCVTTNSLKIANILLNNNNQVNLLGGKYNNYYNTYDTFDLERYNVFDKCIFCIDFITENGEYGIANRYLYDLIKRIIEISKESICLYKNPNDSKDEIFILNDINGIILL